MILLILLGYFIYSKLIFYIVFFITFCPCITYVVLFSKTQEQIKKEKLNKRLTEYIYSSYCEKYNVKLEPCVICTVEFNDKDIISQLPCNEKHCYHSECIRQWADKKTICPLCRNNILSSSHSHRNENEERNLLIRHDDEREGVVNQEQSNVVISEYYRIN